MRHAAFVLSMIGLFLIWNNTFGQDALDGDRLREAARAGNLQEISAYLDRGVPVDLPARHNVTALRLAAERGQLAAVKLLVERGANVNATESFFHSSVLEASLEQKQRAIALYLLENGATARAEALIWAIEQADMGVAEAALAGDGVETLDLAVARKAAEKKGDASLTALVQSAVSKKTSPSIPAHQLDPKRLEAFAGKFRDKELDVVVSVRGDTIALSIGGDEPIELVPVTDRRFESAAGDLRLDLSGRAGTIEWANLVRADGATNFLSLANAAEVKAIESAGAVSLETAPREATRPWRQFRGESATGIGDAQGAPADWDMSSGKNIRFKTPIPGIALASPIIDGGRIYVTTAISSKGDVTFRTGLYGDGTSVDDTSEHSFRLVAIDAANGSIAWEKEVAKAIPTVRRHLKSSLANSTPATDGQRIVVLFGMIGVLAAYDRDGDELWRRDIGVLDANDPQSGSAEWGHASSPIIWKDLVIIQADRRRDSFLAAYRIDSGEEVWRVARDEVSTWSTPAIAPSSLGDELVTNGTVIRAYQPRTGELIWSLGPNSEVVVATPVAADGMVYVTAGYPPVRPVYAIRAGSRGDLSLPAEASSSPAVAWSHARGGTYLPTPILYRGHLVTINNNGVLTAYRADSGAEVHRARIATSSTSFSSSPVAADGRIYVASEEGNVYILRGEPGYELLTTHPMGEVVMATPAISDGLLVIRTLNHVVGIAEPEASSQ